MGISGPVRPLARRMKLIRGPLAKLRLKAKLTSDAAAQALGCSRTWLGRIERGESSPSQALVEKMAQIFDTTPEEISRLATLTQVKYLKHLMEANK